MVVTLRRLMQKARCADRTTLALLVSLSALTLPHALSAAEWPDGAKVAVALTFDLDAETVWWNNADTMTGNPSSLSQGRYGPNVAVPKILSVLEKRGIKATFFIPAWVAENYSQAVRSIAAAGHEIAAHGVKHISPVLLTPDEELQVLQESIRVLENIGGSKPRGYRAPSWAISDVTLELAAQEGFSYSSNRLDADLPYLHDNPRGLVELPISWVLDDAPYFWFDEDSWNKTIHSAADVKAIWQEEFVAAYETGGYVNLTMHPQIIGRPARLRMLDELMGWMTEFDGVWFATCDEVAEHVKKESGGR